MMLARWSPSSCFRCELVKGCKLSLMPTDDMSRPNSGQRMGGKTYQRDMIASNQTIQMYRAQ